MGQSQYVSVHVDNIEDDTDKALLCVIDGERVWIPLSQIADAEDYAVGDRDLTLSLTEWIVREKGLEIEE